MFPVWGLLKPGMRSSLSAALLTIAIAVASPNALSAEPGRHPLHSLECVKGSRTTAHLEFRAAGREPAWTLEFDGGRCLTFAVHGADLIVFATPPEAMRLVNAGGALYGLHTPAHELQIGIERKNCLRDVNGAFTTHTVTIRLDGREYRGCGGARAGSGE